MDPSKFIDAYPGEIVPIRTRWGPDHSFVPDPLPPLLKLTDRIWQLLVNARQQLYLLEGVGRTLPNPAVILRPMRDREAILSSVIEGTHSTPRELLLFELDQDSIQKKSADSHREVFNYVKALEQGTQSDLPISSRLIRELHQTLMSGVRGRDKSPGELRRIPVGVRAQTFIPPPHLLVEDEISDLEKYANSEDSPFDALIDCFLFHYQFETIHPFADGNGRVGRLLLTMMIQRCCSFTKPWLHMSEYFERHRDTYFDALFKVSAQGAWIEWLDFCLTGVEEQAKATLLRCERLLEIKKDFEQRIATAGGTVRLSQIVEQIFHTPFVRVTDLRDRFEVTYPTANSDVERLVGVNILQELPDIYPKTFFSPEVYTVAYDELDL